MSRSIRANALGIGAPGDGGSRATDLLILSVAGLLTIALTVASFLLAPPAGVVDRASTYSARHDGAKAAFLLLKELGYDVARSFEPIAALCPAAECAGGARPEFERRDEARESAASAASDAAAGVGAPRFSPDRAILIVASPSRTASQQDRRALQRFIEAGGVVLATGDAADFLPRLGRTPSLRLAVPPAERYEAAPGASALTRSASVVQIAPEVVSASTAPDYATLYRAAPRPGETGARGAAGRAGVLAARFGRGDAIWWIGSSPLLNGTIDDPGHVELLLNIVGPPGDRLVVWDEYYHGRSRGFGSYLAGTPLPAALAQVGLMALVALFTFTRRRGPILALAEEPRASSMEFVEAMGALYAKAGAASGAVEIGRARLRRLLVVATQLPSGSSDEQIARAAAVRYPLDAGELIELLSASAGAADAPNLAPARALALSQRLQATAAIVGGR